MLAARSETLSNRCSKSRTYSGIIIRRRIMLATPTNMSTRGMKKHKRPREFSEGEVPVPCLKRIKVEREEFHQTNREQEQALRSIAKKKKVEFDAEEFSHLPHGDSKRKKHKKKKHTQEKRDHVSLLPKQNDDMISMNSRMKSDGRDVTKECPQQSNNLVKKKKHKHRKVEANVPHPQDRDPSLADSVKNETEDANGSGYMSYHERARQDFLNALKTEEVTTEIHDDKYSALHESFTTTASGLEKLQQQHGPWRKGKWSKQELDILKRNLNQYSKENGIEDIENWVKSSDSKRGFYRFIAREINRPLFLVYRRVLRVFDDSNYVGRWTPEMEQQLKRLHLIHGNKWSVIGSHLGVSSQLCFDHWRRMKKKGQHEGLWSPEEEVCLQQVLERHGVDCVSGDGSLPADLNWEVIASEMKSRSAIQCRQKWRMILAWKVQGGEKRWTSEDNLKLLEALGKEEEAEDEEEVDWETLAQGWESARSKYFLRQKWMALKRSVPRYEFKTFQECVDHLLEFQLPRLRQKISIKKEK